MAKNLIIHVHNLLVVPFVMVLSGAAITWNIMYYFLGLVLVVFALAPIMMLLSLITIRFRDFSQILASFLAIVFYATPVLWNTDYLNESIFSIVLSFNPFAIALAVLRDPFLGVVPPTNYFLLIGLVGFGSWIIGVTLFNKYKERIVYWL
jgi:ABC-type polysaccharide/polyol phosphate export permease